MYKIIYERRAALPFGNCFEIVPILPQTAKRVTTASTRCNAGGDGVRLVRDCVRVINCPRRRKRKIARRSEKEKRRTHVACDTGLALCARARTIVHVARISVGSRFTRARRAARLTMYLCGAYARVPRVLRNYVSIKHSAASDQTTSCNSHVHSSDPRARLLAHTHRCTRYAPRCRSATRSKERSLAF